MLCVGYNKQWDRNEPHLQARQSIQKVVCENLTQNLQ